MFLSGTPSASNIACDTVQYRREDGEGMQEAPELATNAEPTWPLYLPYQGNLSKRHCSREQWPVTPGLIHILEAGLLVAALYCVATMSGAYVPAAASVKHL